MCEKVVVKFFDVGKGDATVIEIHTVDEIFYLVYDICKRQNSNPVAEYLASRTKTIHAVIISHFHRDHISGVADLFSDFEVKELYIPPYFHSRNSIISPLLDKFRRELNEHALKIDDDAELERISDQATLINKIYKSCLKQINLHVESLEGIETPFYLESYPDELGKVYLPLKKFNEKVAGFIASVDYPMDVFSNMNDSSVAILFNFLDFKLLMTGDSEKNSWYQVKGKFRNRRNNSLQANVLKLSHHGSKYNTDRGLLEFFFETNKSGSRFAVISGDGNKHPAKELLADLDSLEIKPFCTGLSKHCVPKIKELDPSIISSYFTEYLANYEIVTPVECQGDITINIEANSMNITSKTGSFCPYRLPTPPQP